MGGRVVRPAPSFELPRPHSDYRPQLQGSAVGGRERNLARRFVVRSERGDAQEGRKPSELAPKPASETDQIPSLAELAAMLEGLDG